MYRIDDGEWLDFDATIEETFAPTWDVSDHPTEDGVTISDNVAARPDRFTLRVMMTESPLGASATSGPERTAAALAFLRACKGRFLLVGTTRYGVYDDVLLAGFRYTVDRRRSLTFDLDFRQVAIATSASVTIPAKAPTARAATGLPSTTDAGAVSPTESAALGTDETSGSYAYRGATTLGRVFGVLPPE